MSGSGGGPAPHDSGRQCSDLEFDTTLSSPKRKVVRTLKKKDKCSVELREVDGLSFIAVLTAAGEIAGTITSHVPELLRCLQGGWAFEATVLKIDGGVVRVHVESEG